MKYFNFLSIIIIILFTITIVSFSLSNINKLHFLKKVASFFFGIAILIFIIYLISYYIYLLLGISIIIFKTSKYFIGFLISEELSKYFSFLIALVLLAYFPQHLGSSLLKLILLTKKNDKYDMVSSYRKLVKLINPKLWIYLFATISTLIASIEKISENVIIINNTWNEVKPFIFEAVVTFIALDTFISMIKSKGFINETKILFLSFIEDILCSIIKEKDKS